MYLSFLHSSEGLQGSFPRRISFIYSQANSPTFAKNSSNLMRGWRRATLRNFGLGRPCFSPVVAEIRAGRFLAFRSPPQQKRSVLGYLRYYAAKCISRRKVARCHFHRFGLGYCSTLLYAHIDIAIYYCPECFIPVWNIG